MLSHEIKNMITSINGYAVGITEGVYSSEAEINEALDIIKSKSKDLENITESLLMLSRIENRIIDISREDVDFEKIINDLLKLYDPELGKNMLVIKKTFDIKPGTKLLSDKYLIQTVVSNLINNAIKYSTTQSEIAINAMSDDKSIIIAVSNSGHGISEEEKDKIFNMFYRSEKYEFKNIKGFGLGLAISRRIANILGADLDFNSIENINTFTFKIPLA
jgi:signal transduction histidine kinase